MDDLKKKSPLLNNVYDEMKRIEDDFERKLDEATIENDNSFFSQNEVNELRIRLDSLYAKFEELKVENNIKDNQLKEIKQEIEKLKGNLELLPKNTWLKSGGKKVLSLIAKYINPETVKALSVEVVKGLLENK